MKKAYIFSILGVLVVLAVISISVFHKPATYKGPDNFGFKEYINTEYGFKFKHPDRFEVKPISFEKVKGFGVALVDTTKKDKTIWIYYPINKDPAYNPNAKSINDYVDNYQSSQYKYNGLDRSTEIYGEVRIKSQDGVRSINSNNVLKQIYASGFQVDETFDTSDVLSEENSLRYIVSSGDKMLSFNVSNVNDTNTYYYEEFIENLLTSFELL
jgi:hypothetical protein